MSLNQQIKLLDYLKTSKMKSFVPKCIIHQYGTFPYSTTNLFRVHPSDAVYITFVRNDIIKGEKQD